MKLLQLFAILVAALGPTLVLGQLCPPAQVLSPCTCSESPLNIRCSGIQGQFNLKEVLDNAAEFVREDVIFNSLVVSNLPQLVEIEEGTVENLKFELVTFDGNENLEWISPLAFNASRSVTRRLSLYGSKLHNEAPRERDIFDLVNGFEKLEYLDLTWNRISTIPSNAFQNMPFLRDIFLLNNRIYDIGSHAFGPGLPSLSRVYLSYNSIPSEGLPEDAFDGIGNGVTIQLRCNDMQHLDKKSFHTLLDRAGTVNVNDGREGDCWGHTQRFHCDERADWICDAEDIYRPKLEGFLCKELSGLRDVWEYCDRRNKKLQLA